MPFDLYITRATLPANRIQFTAEAGEEDHGISEREFHLLFDRLPAFPIDHATYWVYHPGEQIPWFSAQWTASGSHELGYCTISISWTHYRFLFAWGSVFDLALEWATCLKARVIEGTRNLDITFANIDQLLDPGSDYVLFHASFWKDVRYEADRSGHAPLEFPVGTIDKVSEYCCFSISNASMQRIEDVCAVVSDKFEIDYEQNAATCLSENGERRLSKVLVRADNRIQVTPYYWEAPFRHAFATTRLLAHELGSRLGGEIYFSRHPLTGTLSEQIAAYTAELGVDFYLWQRQLLSAYRVSTAPAFERIGWSAGGDIW